MAFYQGSPNWNPQQSAGRRLLSETCPVGIIPQEIHSTERYGSLIHQTYSFDNVLHTIQNESRPFIDNTFPNSHKTHYSLPPTCSQHSSLVWEKISRVFPNSSFTPSSGPKSTDVVQGLLGNCWFVGALATIASNLIILERVMPKPWPSKIHQQYPVYCLYFFKQLNQFILEIKFIFILF